MSFIKIVATKIPSSNSGKDAASEYLGKYIIVAVSYLDVSGSIPLEAQ